MNQLKLNLNAVVDNLNLVNVVHKPDPIIIQRAPSNSNPRAFNSTVYHSNSQFEFIDETKLSMYSYLVQRELKTKEWLSKYEANNFEKPVKLVNSKPQVGKTTNPKNVKNEQSSATLVNPTPRNSQVQSVKSIKSNDSTDTKKLSHDLVKTLENFLNILTEFKDERLKVVFNDPIEEEKQNRIHLEQIKYLSRSIYNYQNQINTLLKMGKNRSESSVQRLVHTMRQIMKLVVSIGDNYPYRQDKNLISEKLYLQFFKNLNLSIKSYVQCIPRDDSIDHINSLIQECEGFFTSDQDHELVEIKEKKVETSSDKNKKSNQVLNVIRVSRKGPEKKVKKDLDIQVVSSKRVYDKKKPKNHTSNIRFEISPPRVKTDRPVYENKTIKTAKLFPSNKRSRPETRSHPDLDFIPIKEKSVDKKTELNQIRRSIEQLNSSLNELNISNDQTFKPAFRHLSSPKLSKIGYNLSRSRSRSADRTFIQPRRAYSNDSVYDDEEDVHVDLYEPKSLKYKKSILKSHPNSEKLLSKLDLIRQENNAIRKKYEHLSYHDSESNGRRPYEECYLKKDRQENLESKVTFNHVYRPLNGPSLEQLKRVVKYSQDFEDFNRKTSVTKIGQTEFDDFDLFELLSNDLFDDLFDSIYDEVENINDQMTKNLIDNEFENEPELSNRSQMNDYDQSFEQTIMSSRQTAQPRKNSKTSTTKTPTTNRTSKTSSTSNYDDNVRSHVHYEQQQVDDVQEDIPNQINTQYSSFHSNVEETLSSISDE